MTKEGSRVGVCCHDAGGAELVSAWIKRRNVPVVWADLAGPAKAIFSRKLPSVPPMHYSDFRDVDLVVCGSGYSNFERGTWLAAEAAGKCSAVYLDHWKNYRMRFEFDDRLLLPRAIWVTDRHAYALAKQELPGANIVHKGNPYMDEIREEVAMYYQEANPIFTDVKLEDPSPRKHILVVYDRGEDLLYLGHKWEVGEYFIRNRPHPSDAPSERSLAEDIAWADIVIGWDSMALAMAYTVGRETYSVLPMESRSIPYSIEYLSDAVIGPTGA